MIHARQHKRINDLTLRIEPRVKLLDSRDVVTYDVVSDDLVGFFEPGDTTDNMSGVTGGIKSKGLNSFDIVDDQTKNAGEILQQAVCLDIED